ncbi:MAG: CerR family C-terminal domain-containing protein [Victivallaceae bacterium]|jgi:AcrR family transcriptional regulator
MTKNKIIVAALEEFAEHGYHAATIRNICRRAGVNIAAINYHFSGKAELYRQSLEMVFKLKPPLPCGEKIQSDSDLKSVLQDWIKTFLYRSNNKIIQENLLLKKIVHHEMLNPSEIFDELIETHLKPDVYSLESILRKGLPPDISEKEIKMRVFSILGNCVFYLFHERLVEKIWADGDFLEDNIEMVVDHITEQSLMGLKLIQ